MKAFDQRFMEALRASLHNEKVKWDEEIPVPEWMELFRLAQIHDVLPMIFEAVYACPSARKVEPNMFAPFKRNAMQQVMLQTVKTNEFLQLNRYLQENGLTPLVVKGIICRNLYPQPDYRKSGDEDVLIPAGQFAACHGCMEAYGMYRLQPDQDINTVYEVPYGKQNSPLYIELHKSLFPPESDAYGDFNRFFDGVFERAIQENIQGCHVLTMGRTDHLFYLICHAFKHFLHSGFGLRQVCDIVMFANTYGRGIDWLCILEHCREIRADLFAAALFKIGETYLDFCPEEAGYPAEWQQIAVDETAMLEDLLDSGVYGGADMSRKHSSNITLNAVAAQKRGKNGAGSVLRTIFPPAKNLEGRYPYLKKRPYLLPAAWLNRIVKYRKETQNASGNNAADAIKIGNERVALLRQYGIIK